MTTVETHDYQIRDWHGFGWVVVDGTNDNRIVAGPFMDPGGYDKALRTMGRLNGSRLADDLLKKFRRSVGA